MNDTTRKSALIAAILTVALAATLAFTATAGADRKLSIVILGADGGANVTRVLTVGDSAPLDKDSLAPLLGVTADQIVSVTEVTTPPTTPVDPKPKPKPKPKPRPKADHGKAKGHGKGQKGRKAKKRRAANPALTGPALLGLPGLTPLGTPGELIADFRIPPFLLPIYQAAAIEYGLPWQVLAAINSIETDYGRNLSVSSAGAVGWMQFMPATWSTYAVDANADGKADPYNPADAIFAAAKYLKAAGSSSDLRKAIFAYNHADWYVEDVLKRARLLAGLPDELVSSLTALAQATYPVPGPSRVEANGAADGEAESVTISAGEDSPVVATSDSTVVRVGFAAKVGNYVTLKDAFGNKITYSGLGRVSRRYVTRRPSKLATGKVSRELNLKLHDGSHADADGSAPKRKPVAAPAAAAGSATTELVPDSGGRRRLFANPSRPSALQAGGRRQLKEASGPADLRDWFTVPVRIARSEAAIKPLTPGATVIAGTIVGRANTPIGARRGTFTLSIRPAGENSPVIDPRPIVSGWKLLARTARGTGRGDLGRIASSASASAPSIGQVMLMDKSSLARRVLGDGRITVYDCGRRDIEAGIVDGRVLATLIYLADRGMNPTVSSLQCGHGYLTTSGNVSEHSFGSAVDIAAINGTPILGHQGVGSITDRANRALMALQGTMRPHQIISLMQYPGASNTLALGDHDDHIHVGFHPDGQVPRDGSRTLLAGTGAVTGSQWSTLVDRLREVPNPKVTVKPSRYSTSGKRP